MLTASCRLMLPCRPVGEGNKLSGEQQLRRAEWPSDLLAVQHKGVVQLPQAIVAPNRLPWRLRDEGRRAVPVSQAGCSRARQNPDAYREVPAQPVGIPRQRSRWVRGGGGGFRQLLEVLLLKETQHLQRRAARREAQLG